MTEINNEAIIEKKLIHKFALHKLAANGGAISIGRFGLRIVYNENNPSSPMVEARIFAIPLGETFKGNINPSLTRLKEREEQKEKQKPLIVEEGEQIEM